MHSLYGPNEAEWKKLVFISQRSTLMADSHSFRLSANPNVSSNGVPLNRVLTVWQTNEKNASLKNLIFFSAFRI